MRRVIDNGGGAGAATGYPLVGVDEAEFIRRTPEQGDDVFCQ